MLQYDRFDQVPEPARQPLADWLLALADNKRVLGLRYAEWATGAPELEADVTVAAMAQYELGHARLLRGVLGDLAEDPRTPGRATNPAEWRSLPALDRPAPSWIEVVALNALVDGLLSVNLASAAAAGLTPLAQRLRKAVAEERYHNLHAVSWVGRLLDGPDDTVARLQAAFESAWPECVAWFGPQEDNGLDLLAEVGVLDAGAADLRQRFLEATAGSLDGRLSLPVERVGSNWRLATVIDWKGWNESTRRHGDPDFDAESFAMITGAHARAMGVED